MDEAYFKSAIPEPCRLFGLRLLPLSLGRFRQLRRFGCAFAREEATTANMEDLLLGVLICSMRCDEFRAFLESEDSKWELKRWGKRIRKEMRREKHFSVLEKFGLFKNYLMEAQQIPRHWDESPSDAASGAHWTQNVEVTLRAELGYSLEEIEEGPLSKALADYFKHAENQGLIRLIGEDEAAQGDANAKIFEELMKKGGASCPGSN